MDALLGLAQLRAMGCGASAQKYETAPHTADFHVIEKQDKHGGPPAMGHAELSKTTLSLPCRRSE